MVVITLALPIRPGKYEAWRRFIQELSGLRRGQYEASRRRLGITKERAWLTDTPQGELVILYLEAGEPLRLLHMLAASEIAFDRWFKRQVLDLHGVDLAQLGSAPASALLFDWGQREETCRDR